MSLIPSPETVVSNQLPTVALLNEAKDWLLEELNDCYFPEGTGRIVPFGSLVRGDAGPRSDIDLAVAYPSGVPFDFYLESRLREIDPLDLQTKILAKMGVSISVHFNVWVSRQGDRLAVTPYDSSEICPTTFDHFGFLARNGNISPVDRSRYAVIQREVRQFSRVDLAARYNDLDRYVSYCRGICGSLQYSREDYWGESYGQIENAVYHTLRKLAGITKTFAQGDGKHQLAGCFSDPRVPLFDELRREFAVVQQFGATIDAVIADCLGRPDRMGEYNAFLASQVPVMVHAARGLINLISQHLRNGTIVDAIASYNRETIEGVTVPDNFLETIDRYRKFWRDEVAVNWVCLGNQVLLARPFAASTVLAGKKTKLVLPLNDDSWWGRRIDPRKMTASGRLDFNYSNTPPTLLHSEGFVHNTGTTTTLQLAQAAVWQTLETLWGKQPTNSVQSAHSTG